jgi:senataxin
LIPLRFRCNKIIQVGDPLQLPATLCSRRAQDFKFAKSFFERIYYNFYFEDQNPIRMLSIQYRMHPEICLFPSSNFYKGKLVTDMY